VRSAAAARRYARALFSLARDESAVDPVRGELADLAAVLDANEELSNVLFRPLRPVAERRAVIRGVCRSSGTSTLLENFLSYLIEQRRLFDFPAIREEFGRLADEAAGRTRAEVVSATPLRDDQRERLRGALAARTGREVDLSVTVDPSLIGGAIATVGGLVFDGSLRTQLSQLRASLMRGH